MTDWTVIVTTLGASGIAGTVGYLGARGQAEVGVRAVEAENARLRAQHAEDHLRNRQSTYHQLLDVLRRFDVVMWSGPGFGEPDFQAFMADFGHLINGGLLFGTEEVRDSATDSMSWSPRLNSTSASAGRRLRRRCGKRLTPSAKNLLPRNAG